MNFYSLRTLVLRYIFPNTSVSSQMAPAGCCCFSNNVRQLILFLTALCVSMLYANVVLFNITAILHEDLDPFLRPVANLNGLHEYSVWHDRKRREISAQHGGATKADDDGQPILPYTRSTTAATTTTATAARTSPRLVFFSNSPSAFDEKDLKFTTKRNIRTTNVPVIKNASPTKDVVFEAVQKAIDAYERRDRGEFDNFAKKNKTSPMRPNTEDYSGKFDGEPFPKEDVSSFIERSLLYSAPGIGCLIAAVPSLLAVSRAGIRKLLTTTLVLSGIFLIILPFIVSLGFTGLFTIRFLLGASFAVAFPVIGAVSANWGTLKEQLTFISIMLLFVICAPLISWPFTTLLHSNDVNTRYIYIAHAVLSFIYAFLFFIFYRDRPQYHPWVNGLELNRIVAGKVHELKANRASSIPGDLARSLSAWAIWVACFGFFIAISFFVEYLPSFYACQQVFLVDYFGFYNSLPYPLLIVAFAIGGLTNLYSCSSTTAHIRFFNSVGFVISATVMIAIPIAFHVEDTSLGLCLLMLGLAPLGFTVSGFLRSTTVVGRLFAQHIIAVMALVWALVQIVLPFTVNAFVKENNLNEWTTTFIVIAASLVVCAIVFGIFGRGRSAGWAQSSWDPLINNKMRDLSPIDVSADECGLYEMRLIEPLRS